VAHSFAGMLRAQPLIPFKRKEQRLAPARHRVWWPVGDATRKVIERLFAVAMRYVRLDTTDAAGIQR
jgi:hypothetical protein